MTAADLIDVTELRLCTESKEEGLTPTKTLKSDPLLLLLLLPQPFIALDFPKSAAFNESDFEKTLGVWMGLT